MNSQFVTSNETGAIDWHPSFVPASEILRERDAQQVTPLEVGRDAIKAAKGLIKKRKSSTAAHIASAWGATSQGARRTVLRAAGLNPDYWERPIDSFSDSERAEIRAAALAAVRTFERVLNAV